MNKRTVDELIKIKYQTEKSNVVSILPDSMIYEAACLLKEKNIGILIVKNDSEMLGVLSERDIVQKSVVGSYNMKKTTVDKIMSTHIECVVSTDTLYDCYLRFISVGCRHLPVLDLSGELIGVLSSRDIMGELIQEFAEDKPNVYHQTAPQ